MQAAQLALGRCAAEAGQAHDFIQVEALVNAYEQQGQKLLLRRGEQGLCDHHGPNLSTTEPDIGLWTVIRSVALFRPAPPLSPEPRR